MHIFPPFGHIPLAVVELNQLSCWPAEILEDGGILESPKNRK